MNIRKILALLFIFIVLKPSCIIAQDSLSLTIYFDYNKDHLNTIATQELKSIANIDTNSYNISNIYVAAHCDQVGSHVYNNILSKKRALNIVSYFINSFQVPADKISYDFFGKRNLATEDTNSKARNINRRANITVFFAKKIITTIKETTITEYNKDVETENIPTTFSQKITDTIFKVGDTIRLNNILFYPGRHKFLAISNTQLFELFNAMKDLQKLEIEIHGHICCNVNTDDALDYETGKKDLSYQRAKAVHDYLVGKGINPKRMKYVGFGHQYPLNEEKDSYQMQQNRRVEIKIVQK